MKKFVSALFLILGLILFWIQHKDPEGPKEPTVGLGNGLINFYGEGPFESSLFQQIGSDYFFQDQKVLLKNVKIENLSCSFQRFSVKRVIFQFAISQEYAAAFDNNEGNLKEILKAKFYEINKENREKFPYTNDEKNFMSLPQDHPYKKKIRDAVISSLFPNSIPKNMVLLIRFSLIQ